MPSEYKGTRDVKKEHYKMGVRLTEQKKIRILKENFKTRVGYELNLEDPKTFNEKIMWSKLYYQDPLITKCCDKFAVKEYVAEKIGAEHTVPNLAQWDDPDKITLDQLPDQFALKVNWSSGYNIIVPDKARLDLEDAKTRLKRWMKPDRNAYYQFFNWGYKHMKPVVYAEKYMEQVAGQLYDYKFFCFNGKPEFFFIATDRSERLTHDFYDMDFNHLPFHYGNLKHSDIPLEKPRFYEEMVRCAKILAEPFPFVRVDFYETDDNFYVGEMTFYPGGGILPFNPHEWDRRIGDYYHLPAKRIVDREDTPAHRMRVALAEGGYTVKKALTGLRRAIVRHDVWGRKHYVTLFGCLRFPVSFAEIGAWKYAVLSGMQVKYKRIAPKAEEAVAPVAPRPVFEPLKPYEAYMMEDRITYEMRKHYCEQKAYAQLKYFPDLDNPRSWNEKLLWLALNYKNPIHHIASDKALAKAWISQRVGSEYVVPLLGAYSNVNDIDFDALPEKFVMKANEGWGAGQVILVKDKYTADIDLLKAHASSWLYPWSSYYYNNMCITDEKPERPLVVFEEFLEHGDGRYLDDYKFYCCNGEVRFALIVTDRGETDQARTFVDADWNVLPVRRGTKLSNQAPKKPQNLDKMFELARTLSKDVPMVRIDFYNMDGRIYVGEMTFTPGMFLRFEPKEWDFRLGEYLDLGPAMAEMAAKNKA